MQSHLIGVIALFSFKEDKKRRMFTQKQRENMNAFIMLHVGDFKVCIWRVVH